MKQYDSYKDSGVQWIGEIPSHWKIVRGKYSTEVVPGFPFNSDQFTYEENDQYMPLIRIRDIANENTEVQYKGTYPQEAVVKNGDILVGMDGDFNISRWRGGNALLNQRVCKLLGTKLLDLNYVYYMLHFPLKCINDVTYSTTVKHLSTNDILNSYLPIPPLSEQKTIASYLDMKCSEIDKAIATQQKRIELLQELRQNIITHAVTRGINPDAPLKDSGVEWIGRIPSHWDMRKLKYNFYIYAGATPNTGNDKYWDGNIIWITPADYKTDDKYVSEGQRTITEEGYNSCNTQLVPKGSLIFSKRAPIGTVAISNVDLCTNQGCLSCVAKDVNTLFFYYLASVYTDIFDLLGSGATFKEISADTFANVKLPLPPLCEQQAIVTHIEAETAKLDKQVAKANRQISLLQELKQSIITEVVTGKRKVC